MARTGNGTIPAGVDSYFVAEPTVAADTYVDVAFTSDTGDYAGAPELEDVIKDPGYGFTIGLSSVGINTISFDYRLE
jgi:hypothetical protein